MTKDIVTVSYPTTGGVAVLDYKGVPHYAYIEEVRDEGIQISESNFNKGKYSSRFLTWQYLKDRGAKYWPPN